MEHNPPILCPAPLKKSSESLKIQAPTEASFALNRQSKLHLMNPNCGFVHPEITRSRSLLEVSTEEGFWKIAAYSSASSTALRRSFATDFLSLIE